MSLMKTLAKVAIGVALAKGAGKMMQNRGSAQQADNGGLFGGGSTDARQASGGSFEDQMGDLLGGGRQAQSSRPSGQSGGLGGLLESLSKGQRNTQTTTAPSSGGGLDELLGGLAGGGAGGLGGLLGGLLGAAKGGSSGGGFGDMLNEALAGGAPKAEPSADQEAAAGLMLSAMIQAAKSDGQIDAAEQQKLLGKLGDVSAEERTFVQAEMQKPVDIKGLAQAVPRGLEAQVYAMSVMGIDLDSRAEAQYLHEFAGALGIDQDGVNHIHAELGVPALYS